MKTKPRKRGAPRKSAEKSKGELVQIRVNAAEKQAFLEAAELDGKSLSEWIRDRLRSISRDELAVIGRRAPFLPSNVPIEKI